MSAQMAALREHWKDDAKFANFVKGLRALNVPVHRSTSAMLRLVVAGEYSIADAALFQDVLREKDRGSPLEYPRFIPPVVSPQYIGIYAKSPHPNAARLLAEWMLSPAGQAVFDSLGRTGSRKGFRGKASLEGAWPSDIKPIALADKGFLEDPKKWLDTYVKPLWEAK